MITMHVVFMYPIYPVSGRCDYSEIGLLWFTGERLHRARRSCTATETDITNVHYTDEAARQSPSAGWRSHSCRVPANHLQLSGNISKTVHQCHLTLLLPSPLHGTPTNSTSTTRRSGKILIKIYHRLILAATDCHGPPSREHRHRRPPQFSLDSQRHLPDSARLVDTALCDESDSRVPSTIGQSCTIKSAAGGRRSAERRSTSERLCVRGFAETNLGDADLTTDAIAELGRLASWHIRKNCIWWRKTGSNSTAGSQQFVRNSTSERERRERAGGREI